LENGTRDACCLGINDDDFSSQIAFVISGDNAVSMVWIWWSLFIREQHYCQRPLRGETQQFK
jgi:hypothetical protein